MSLTRTRILSHRNVCWSAILALGLAAATACGGGETTGAASAASGVDAGIVPGADLVLRVDYRGLQESPLVRDLTAKSPETAPVPTDAWTQFVEKTGITAESLETLLLSVDLDTVDPSSGASKEEQIAKAKAVFAMALGAPLSLEAIANGAAAANDVDAKVEDVDGVPMVKITATDEKGTHTAYSAVSRGGETAYFAMNPESLRGALEREGSGRVEPLSPELTSAEGALAPGAQVRLAFLAPESWRSAIREQAESPDGGMVGGMLAPFAGLKSIAFGVGLDADMEAQLVGDLGEEAAAQQVSSLFQMMVLPMLRSAAASDASAPDLSESLNVSVAGPTLRFDLKLSATDMAAFQKKASEMAGTAAGAN